MVMGHCNTERGLQKRDGNALECSGNNHASQHKERGGAHEKGSRVLMNVKAQTESNPIDCAQTIQRKTESVNVCPREKDGHTKVVLVKNVTQTKIKP